MDGISSFPTADDADTGIGQQTKARSRDSLFLLARLTLAGGEAHDVRVRNLSEGGMMAEFDGAVALGDPVRVQLRGIGEVSGRIAWAAEGRVGISLDRPIDPKKARKPVATRAKG